MSPSPESFERHETLNRMPRVLIGRACRALPHHSSSARASERAETFLCDEEARGAAADRRFALARSLAHSSGAASRRGGAGPRIAPSSAPASRSTSRYCFVLKRRCHSYIILKSSLQFQPRPRGPERGAGGGRDRRDSTARRGSEGVSSWFNCASGGGDRRGSTVRRGGGIAVV